MLHRPPSLIVRFATGVRGFIAANWNGLSLVILLSIAATIPIVQFASLGYMLECAARIARGRPIRECFPGSQIAGRLVIVLACVGLSWLPIWLLADMAYTAELIHPGSTNAARLRIVARVVSAAWVMWVAWAIVRGGKLRHFVWPAPILAIRSLFRSSFWRRVEDDLWGFVASLHLPKLLWLGLCASFGALIWLIVPASLMVLALKTDGAEGRGVLGLIGAMLMWWCVLLLPFLQVHMARESRFMAMFDLRLIRQAFRRAPWAFALSSVALVILAVPLYLLRIEAIPSQLWWILSLFFVVFMFPAKLLIGWALRRSSRRNKDVFWIWRYMAWAPQVAAVGVYLGFLYIAKFALWEGAASMFLQHAFLPPVPFFIQ